jgi:hypothetical protein
MGTTLRLGELGGYANAAAGGILWNLWKPPESEATLTTIGGSNDVNIKLDAPGNYRVRLTLTDTSGGVAYDDLILRVQLPGVVDADDGTVGSFPAAGEKLELDGNNGWQKSLNHALSRALDSQLGSARIVLHNSAVTAIAAGTIAAVKSVKLWAELTGGGTGARPDTGPDHWVPSNDNQSGMSVFAFVPDSIPAGGRGVAILAGLVEWDTSTWGAAGSSVWGQQDAGSGPMTVGAAPQSPTGDGSSTPLRVGHVVIQAADTANPAGTFYFDPSDLYRSLFGHPPLATIADGYSGAAAGDIVAANGDTTVQKADASDAAKMPAVGVIKAVYASDVVEVVRFGAAEVGTVAGGGLAAGKALYVSTTAGQMTVTRPVGSNLVQQVAVCLQTSPLNEFLYCPGPVEVGERTDMAVPISLHAGSAESGTWSFAARGSMPALERTAATSTDVYWLDIIVPGRNATDLGIKPTSLEVKYEVDTADLDDVTFELVKYELGADGAAHNTPSSTLAGDNDAHYDAAHDTAAERGDDTAAPELHKAVITVPSPAYLTTRELLRLKITVDGDAGGAGVFALIGAVMNYSANY